MNKKEAKKLACSCVFELLDGHNNEFLHYSDTMNERDLQRLREGMEELMEELWRRAHGCTIEYKFQ